MLVTSGVYFGEIVIEKFIQKFKSEVAQVIESKATDSSNWINFRNEEANFQMLFPGEPVENIQSHNTDIGMLLVKLYLFQPELGEDVNLLYGAGFTNYPVTSINEEAMDASALEEFFKNAIQGVVTNFNGELVSTSDISYKRHAGKEIQVKTQNGMAKIRMRIFLVGSTAYMTQVVSTALSDQNESITKFMDSFELN